MISHQKVMDCVFALIFAICSFGAHASEEQGVDLIRDRDGMEVLRFANATLAEAILAVNAAYPRIRLVITSDKAAIEQRISAVLRPDEAAEAIARNARDMHWKVTRRTENGITIITLKPR